MYLICNLPSCLAHESLFPFPPDDRSGSVRPRVRSGEPHSDADGSEMIICENSFIGYDYHSKKLSARGFRELEASRETTPSTLPRPVEERPGACLRDTSQMLYFLAREYFCYRGMCFEESEAQLSRWWGVNRFYIRALSLAVIISLIHPRYCTY